MYKYAITLSKLLIYELQIEIGDVFLVGYFTTDSFSSISQVIKEHRWRTPLVAWASSQPWALLSLIAFTTPFVFRGATRLHLHSVFSNFKYFIKIY